MSAAPYIFPTQQAEFLRALRDGRYRAPARTRNVPASTSLVARMPPIYEQALRGTCVANAVTAMLEYYEDCKMRLSVQYLFAATKEVERAALERNLSRLRMGEPLDPEFEHFHHSKLLQLRMMADANGGINAPVMKPYLTQFEETVRTRYESMEGSLLRSCFNVLEYRGTCRYALWPYAGVSAAPLFGPGDRIAYPPGSDDDAKKHRVVSGLYLLPAPNNVDEIRGILAGVNDRRPMPVCVTVSFFAGCDGETFTFPRTEETEAGLAAKDAWLGVHGMLIVGYVDNAATPGGGYFLVRNSLGEAWGNRGYGKLPYAYVACFALEAGTILQDLVDYTGDGYGGLHGDGSYGPPRRRRRGLFMFLNLLAAAALVGGTWLAVRWYQEQNAPVPSVPSAPTIQPFAEVTVYSRNAKARMALPPPWDGIKGEAIDGGMVFRLPVKTQDEVDEIRRRLDDEPTLREKRGKALTYDLVSFFDLVSDDLNVVKNTIGKFRAEGFLVKFEGESNGALRVSTISPRGFEQRLKLEFNLEIDDHGRWHLTSKAEEPRVRTSENGTDSPVVTNVPPVTTNDPPVVTNIPPVVTNVPPVVTNIPPVVTNIPPVVTNIPPVVTNVPPVVADVPPVVTVPKGDTPTVTNTPPPINSVIVMPPSVVSAKDIPKPPVVSATNESDKVVIVGKNGVIARFPKASTPQLPKLENKTKPPKIEGTPSSTNSPLEAQKGVLMGKGSDF